MFFCDYLLFFDIYGIEIASLIATNVTRARCADNWRPSCLIRFARNSWASVDLFENILNAGFVNACVANNPIATEWICRISRKLAL